MGGAVVGGMLGGAETAITKALNTRTYRARELEASTQSAETGTAGKKSAPAESGAQKFRYEDYPADAYYTDGSIYSYDFLTAQKPMQITEMPPLSQVKDGESVSREKASKLGLKNAAAVGRRVTDTVYAVKNRYTGMEIRVSNGGLRHGLDAGNVGRMRTNARLSAVAGEVVQNGIPINGLTTRKSEKTQVKGTYALATLMRSGDRYVVAISTIEQVGQSLESIDYIDVTHSINGRIEKDGRSSTREPGFLTPATPISEINIAEVLEIVNETHRSILSKDVLDHFKEERPQNGYYTGRALFQIADVIEEIAAKIRAAFEGVSADDLGFWDAVKAVEEELDRVQAMWDKALTAASENYNAGQTAEKAASEGGGVQNQAWDAKGNVIVDEDVNPEKVYSTLTAISNGEIKDTNFSFPILKHTPQVYRDYCDYDDRSFVMHGTKARNAMRLGKGHTHALGPDGLMSVIQRMYQPDYIVQENSGKNAGHYVSIFTNDDGDVVAAVDLGSWRSGSGAVAGETGFYNVLITAYDELLPGMPYDSFDDYVTDLFENPNNIVKYDRDVDGGYEAPEDVALSEPLLRSSSGTSSDVIITDTVGESKAQSQVWDDVTGDTAAASNGRQNAAGKKLPGTGNLPGILRSAFQSRELTLTDKQAAEMAGRYDPQGKVSMTDFVLGTPMRWARGASGWCRRSRAPRIRKNSRRSSSTAPGPSARARRGRRPGPRMRLPGRTRSSRSGIRPSRPG